MLHVFFYYELPIKNFKEMLDKLKFNNLVISNSKNIQKARIQILRKIISRMKKLKTLIDKKPDIESNVIKLRKCVAIVECVKKIKRVDIVSRILLLEKSPDKIMTNSHSKPPEVAIAMLASNKIIQALTLKWQQELGLKDIDLKELKQNLNEIRQVKAKNERRKRRKKHFELHSKGENVTKKPKTEKSKEKVKVKKTKKEKSTEGDDNEEIMSDIIENPSKETNVSDEKVIQKKPQKTKNIKTSTKHDVEPISDLEESHNNLVEEVEKIVEIKKESKRSTNSNKEVKQVKEEDIPISKPTFTVDSFFMTATGDSYMSNVVVKTVTPTTNSTTSNESKATTNDSNATRKTPQDSHNKRQEYNKSNWQNDVNLHPSWAAKQKQKSISMGQGKKVVFGDDDDAVPIVAKKIKKEISATQDLHPSWIAKQKLKPTITSFQGKKITFDNDE